MKTSSINDGPSAMSFTHGGRYVSQLASRSALRALCALDLPSGTAAQRLSKLPMAAPREGWEQRDEEQRSRSGRRVERGG